MSVHGGGGGEGEGEGGFDMCRCDGCSHAWMFTPERK